MATNAMLKAGGNEYDVAVFFMVNFLDGLADGVAIPMTDNTMLLIDTSLVKVIMMLDRAAIARDYCERLMPKIKRKAMDNLTGQRLGLGGIAG